jgi:DNA-binding HxlR family transcriptional regulator
MGTSKLPGSKARGTTTGRPIMVLLDVLGQRWTLRVLWELRSGRLTFRELRSRCEDVSPSVLNARLKTLRACRLVDHAADGYGLSARGAQLGAQLTGLDRWARAWARELDPPDG